MCPQSARQVREACHFLGETMQTTKSFAERVQKFIKEERAITNLLKSEGKLLIEHLCRKEGSLRKVAKKSGFSPTYLSQVHNQKNKLSPEGYIKLSEVK